MLMTTEERTQYVMKWRHKLRLPFCMNSEHCYFHISPNIVVFQQFTPGMYLSVMVTIRNVTPVSRYVKNIYETNPFFAVEFCGANFSTMIAPGLSVTYKVKFMPERKEDYQYQLKFATDIGDIIIPVIAISPRGILDFPDRIEIPATAAKIPSLKTIFVRNVGDIAAAFTLYTDNPCFWIEPSKGRIEEEESLQFIVHFLSNKAGDFEANLFLEYDTGEKLCIDLQSSAENCQIRIDRGTVRLEETFLGLSRSKTLLIHNRSNYTVKYKWMLFESIEADNERKEHYKKLSQLIYENELPRCVNLDYYNVCTPNIHKLIYQRIYTDQLESLVKETFEYKNMYFFLSPIEAEIWPQSSIEVTVYFRAVELGEITSTAYLEVTGREERIPVTLYGTGKGPILQLNVLTIDLSNIYMCSVHNYEIIAGNRGHICGTLIYKEKPTDFGGTINVTPPSLNLKPDELKSFNLSFSSNYKGIDGGMIYRSTRHETPLLTMRRLFACYRGCIICPTLHFDKESLDFGTTALGFSTRQDVYLHNLALIPVAFTLTVLNDGDEVALTHEEFARSQTKPSFPSNPREFEVSPEEGVVASNDSMRIKLIYTANIARIGHTMIQVDMWDSGSHPVLLPITFSGKVSPLTIVPQDITVRFCFLNYPYSRTIDVTNNSDIDGYFYFIPQQVTEDETMICSFSKYQGYVKSHKSCTIDVTIMMKDLGTYTLTLK
ncbi:hydrocephalus-inducing protein homolog [Apis dorsata]|uniref:hydrocephalus-inducing protein homolog n=1 Tax=Apis dorsata TaxID=7462 RepID=UPI0012937759|nr:hydrocephalus-inducing protein homolog [Apis dorsata]